MAVVFHQLGAPRRDIFSFMESFWRSSSMSASMKERAMVVVQVGLEALESFPTSAPLYSVRTLPSGAL